MRAGLFLAAQGLVLVVASCTAAILTSPTHVHTAATTTQPTSATVAVAFPAAAYSTYCAACHGATGEGTPVFR